LLIIDEGGHIVRSNAAMQAGFGWSPHALHGEPFEVLLALEDRAGRRARFAAYLAQEAPRLGTINGLLLTETATAVRLSGDSFPIEFTMSEYPALDGGRRFAVAITDLTERQHAEHARQSERIAEARANFLRTMSHELRTPLNSVLGFAQVLDQELSGPLNPAQREQVHDILDAGNHLLSLINDVLDLSRIDAGRWVVTLREFNPLELVFEVMSQLRPLADARGLKVRVDTGGAPATFVADVRAVRQILTNLVANAIKFTPSGWIEIRVSTSAEGLVVAVEDSGVGIAAEHQQHLFEEFVQLDTAYQSGGSGLGLAIAQRLVALHGGRIDVISASGQGSTFTVVLPQGLTPDSDAGSGSTRPE